MDYSNYILNSSNDFQLIKPFKLYLKLKGIFPHIYTLKSSSTTTQKICQSGFFKNAFLKTDKVYKLFYKVPLKNGLDKALRTICTGKGQR